MRLQTKEDLENFMIQLETFISLTKSLEEHIKQRRGDDFQELEDYIKAVKIIVSLQANPMTFLAFLQVSSKVAEKLIELSKERLNIL